VGLIFLVGFLLTGQYMHWFLGHLAGLSDAPRMLYRSTHIYLMWSSLLNVALGLYLREFTVMLSRRAQLVGSLLILAGPFLLTAAFFIEPGLNGLERPFTRPAIITAFAGLLLHVVGVFHAEWQARSATR
jgi:hypothetical membrane protein